MRRSTSYVPCGQSVQIVDRNCNVNLDDRRWDRPDLDCELQQAWGIPRTLQLDGHGDDGTVMGACGHDLVAKIGRMW